MKTIRFLVIASVLLLLPLVQAQADPLSFSNTIALQQNGLTQVHLFTNQGVVLTGPQINFLVDLSGMLPPSGSDSLRITFTEAGQTAQELTFQIPFFNGLPLPYTQIFAFTILNQSAVPTNATLRIDILGSTSDFVIPGGPQSGQIVDSYTYSFQVAQPVPEPTTLVLSAIGLTGILARARRRKQASNFNSENQPKMDADLQG
ncbi:hypothetical protein BH18ACI4_BH18ACI4_17790 [soil metagenome]